jgi:hypothetical protein
MRNTGSRKDAKKGRKEELLEDDFHEFELSYLKLGYGHAPDLTCRVTDTLTIEPNAGPE